MLKQIVLCLVFGSMLCALSGCDIGKGSASASEACRATNRANCIIDDVAYGASVFVAVGQGGPSSRFGNPGPWVEVSSDGINWTPADPGYTSTSSVLKSIAYGSSGFVATDGQRVIFSPAGQTWTVDKISSLSNQIDKVEFDGSRYILYTSSTSPASPWKVSDNGVDWNNYGTITSTSTTAGGTPTSIINDNSGNYYAIWQGTSLTTPYYLTATSSNGLAWTPGNATTDSTTTLSQLLYVNGNYIAFGSGSSLNTSTNTTITWGLVAQGTSFDKLTFSKPITVSGQNFAFSKGAYNGQAYVGIGASGAFESADATSWSKVDLSNAMSANSQCNDSTGTTAFACTTTVGIAAALNGGPFVIVSGVGGQGAESPDGINWVTSNL